MSYIEATAVTVLDAWKKADDTPLLLEYLKQPVHSPGLVRDYTLRALVRDLLEKRGVTIPPGVVYKETAPANQ